MYLKYCGGYDEIPKAMDRYLNQYGCHFNKKLCHEAVSRMYTKNGVKKEPITPYSKEQVDEILEKYGVKVHRNKLYDACYVFNMGVSDFFERSIPTEEHLAIYVKNVLDDADAVEGYVFNRFYADCIFMNNPIEWEDML